MTLSLHIECDSDPVFWAMGHPFRIGGFAPITLAMFLQDIQTEHGGFAKICRKVKNLFESVQL